MCLYLSKPRTNVDLCIIAGLTIVFRSLFLCRSISFRVHLGRQGPSLLRQEKLRPSERPR